MLLVFQYGKSPNRSSSRKSRMHAVMTAINEMKSITVYTLDRGLGPVTGLPESDFGEDTIAPPNSTLTKFRNDLGNSAFGKRVNDHDPAQILVTT